MVAILIIYVDLTDDLFYLYTIFQISHNLMIKLAITFLLEGTIKCIRKLNWVDKIVILTWFEGQHYNRGNMEQNMNKCISSFEKNKNEDTNKKNYLLVNMVIKEILLTMFGYLACIWYLGERVGRRLSFPRVWRCCTQNTAKTVILYEM